uniref:PCMD domain-containing protein n=1 Tax=Alloprevotella sp. TaxID=1872471 RepID=UPI003FED5DCB
MKKLYSLLLLATALTANAQQIPNGDFESGWEKCYPWVAGSYITTERGVQPQGWRASNINGADGSYAKDKCVIESTGHNGVGKAVTIQNQKVMGSNWCPGYLTLGTPWNTAETMLASNKDGGTWGGKAFTYKPDAIKFYYKWNMTKPGKASFIGYLWNGTFKQKEVPANTTLGVATKVTMEDRDRNVLDMPTPQGGDVTEKGTLIASYEEYISSSATDWTSKTIKFKYKNTAEVPEKINIIFASTEYFKSTVVKAENPLIIDDVTLVYYKHLSKLTINGSTPSDFVGDETADNTNKVSIDARSTKYTDGCVKAEVAGVAAKKATSYNEETGLFTITVTAGDGEQKVYEIQFADPNVPEENVKTYTNDLSVYVYGRTTEPEQNSINLIESSGHYSLELKNFILGGVQPIGNIKVTNLDVEGKVYSTSQKILITKGDDPNFEEDDWMGPDLGEVPVNVTATVNGDQMVAQITIKDFPGVGDIDVTFAPTVMIGANASVSTEAGVNNVILNRTFAKGWNTVCLPFDVAVTSLPATTKAQEFVSSNGSSLTFHEVADGVLKANVPYLVFFSNEVSDPFYYGGKVEATNPTPVEHNGFTFVGNYEASKSMQGLYGVASEGDVQKIMLGTAGSTLPATCAYFTTKNLNANGLRICFDGGEVTGINQVNGAQAQSAGAVYNLQGIKVSNRGTNNLPAGLYIMQGKKVIVK